MSETNSLNLPRPTLEARLRSLEVRLESLDARSDVETTHLLALFPQWRREIAEVKALGPNQPVPAPLSIQQLVDPRFLESMVIIQAPSDRHGGAYLLPVILAWGVLAGAEWKYREAMKAINDKVTNKADYADIGFFAWWTNQTYGPWLYSGGIAALLLVILLVLWMVNRSAMGALDQIGKDLAAEASELSIDVTNLLRRTPTTAADGATNTVFAAQQLQEAAGAIRTLVEQLADRSTLADHLAASETANTAAASLAEVCGQLTAQAENLAKASGNLSPALESWSNELQPLAHLVDQVTQQNASLHDSAQVLAATTTAWLDRLGPMKAVAEGVSQAANGIATTQGAMAVSSEHLMTTTARLSQLAESVERQSKQFETVTSQLRTALLEIDALSTTGRQS